jgi:hypothetical protein
MGHGERGQSEKQCGMRSDECGIKKAFVFPFIIPHSAFRIALE